MVTRRANSAKEGDSGGPTSSKGTIALPLTSSGLRRRTPRRARFPDHSGISTHIGILESLLGNAAAAHASLAQSASATLPGGFGPLNRHLFAVYAHANLGHWDAAKTSLAAARSAASASTPNAPAAITLAEGYLALKEGRADAAMAAFSTADPGDVVAAAWLSQAHLAAGHGAMAAPLQKRFADNRQISFTDINWLTTKSPPRGGRAAQAKRPPRR